MTHIHIVGADFVSTSESVTFNENGDTRMLTIQTLDDNELEITENFQVGLSFQFFDYPTVSLLTPATVDIIDNDGGY